MVGKPAMLIGSSVEGKRIAESIQVALEYDVDTTVWPPARAGRVASDCDRGNSAM